LFHEWAAHYYLFEYWAPIFSVMKMECPSSLYSPDRFEQYSCTNNDALTKIETCDNVMNIVYERCIPDRNSQFYFQIDLYNASGLTNSAHPEMAVSE
jgi:hypothetical protein